MAQDLPTNTIDLSNLVKYDSNYDISYIEYNRNNIPWKMNTNYIYQDNNDVNDSNFATHFGNLNNNLVIESSSNDIILATSENNKVKVMNNIEVSNNLDANTILTHDISLNNILYLKTSFKCFSYFKLVISLNFCTGSHIVFLLHGIAYTHNNLFCISFGG